jgi:hypothetical protein
MPVLDGSIFQCGERKPTRFMRFLGGNTVAIEDSTIADYPSDCRVQGNYLYGIHRRGGGGWSHDTTNVFFVESN